MNTFIKKSYSLINPKDETFPFIKDNVTFGDVYKALLNNENIQTVMGSSSDLLRKYVFNELAVKLGKSYDYVYDLYQNKGKLSELNNEDCPDKAYLLSVHITAILPIETGLSADIYSVIQSADYGALTNIDDGIDRRNKKTIDESIKDICDCCGLAASFDSVMDIPVQGDFIVSISALEPDETVDTIMRYAERNHDLLYDQMKGNLGDLSNPHIESIQPYLSNEKNVRKNKNIEEMTH